MKTLIPFVIGITVAIAISACAGGSKRPDYDNFPTRSKEYAIFNKCIDGDIKNACEYKCSEYKRDNTCKKDHETIVRLDISAALNNGYIIVSKQQYMNLLRRASGLK